MPAGPGAPPEFARDWQKRFPIDTPPDTLHFCGYKYLIWADVNPAPGQYNWEAVDKWVAELTAVPHMGFAFYPAVYSRMVDGDRGVHTGKQYMAPHWLETEGWQGRKVRFYKDGEPTGWEPDSGYLGALEAFLSYCLCVCLSRNDAAGMGDTPPACGVRGPAGHFINLFPPPNGAEKSDEAKSRP